jgi:hypothetical protein
MIKYFLAAVFALCLVPVRVSAQDEARIIEEILSTQAVEEMSADELRDYLYRVLPGLNLSPEMEEALLSLSPEMKEELLSEKRSVRSSYSAEYPGYQEFSEGSPFPPGGSPVSPFSPSLGSPFPPNPFPVYPSPPYPIP